MNPHRALLLLGCALALGGCSLLGKAGASDDGAGGGVNSAFHAAYYNAQLAKIKGDQNGAKEALLSCLDADPTADVVHYELARLEREGEQWDAARAAIDQALALDATNPWYHKELADIALELGDVEAADRALTWLLDNKPEDDLSAQQLLDLRIAQGDVKGALAVIDVLEREWGPDPQWSIERHNLHLSAGDVESALKALIQLEVDFPDVVEGPLQRARVLGSVGRDAEAEAVLQAALQRTGNGRLHLELAHILTRRGDTEAARDHVRKAFRSEEVPLAEKTDIAWTYVELAEIQVDLREEAGALIALLRAAHPRDAEPLDLDASLRSLMGDADGALSALQSALDLDPNSAERWLDACQLALELSRWAAADGLAERAALRFPNLPVFPYFRGLAQIELGNPRMAERQLKSARNLIVDRPQFESDVLTGLAQLAHDQGDHDASDAWFELAIEVFPQNLFALNNYAYHLAVRGTKLQRAVELAAKVVELAPGEANFEDTYAWALHRAGEHEEALTWIELALYHEGDAPGATVLEHAGDILQALGRNAEARQRWQSALDDGGDATRLTPKIEGR